MPQLKDYHSDILKARICDRSLQNHLLLIGICSVGLMAVILFLSLYWAQLLFLILWSSPSSEILHHSHGWVSPWPLVYTLCDIIPFG